LGYTISTLLLAEMLIIASGTWAVLSWDIMEPISYLMGLGNFTFGFGWYCLYITSPEKSNPVNWFKTKSEAKMQRRMGVT
jgi:hypothetical protein